MRILLAEDDTQLNKALTYQLESADFSVDSCSDGEEALFYGEQNIYDVILLDRMLPFMEGTDVLTILRKKGIATPIILITALGTLADKVTGLDLGADDYLVKPFAFEELLARIRTALRHAHTAVQSSLSESEQFQAGDLHIDFNKHKVLVRGEDVHLTQNEYRIVVLLARYSGRVITYDAIMQEIWGPNMKSDNKILRVNMANIRRKIEKNPAEPEFIFTEAGVGYRLLEAN